jgi:ADP-heptose:LPS heptosyltransferase
MSAGLRRARRGARRMLGRALARGGPARSGPLDPAGLRRVLVCRLNRRLGNLVLLTPLLRSLAASLPDCEIDVLVGGAAAAVLVGARFVHRVERARMRGMGTAWDLPRLVRRLRRRAYDLAIDPCLSSTTNRMALLLCGARQRLGFEMRDGWAPLTCAVRPALELAHEALRPLELLQAALPPSSRRIQRELDLGLGEAELADGRARLSGLIGPAQSGVAVGFFADAAPGKRLETAWWRELVDALLRRRADVRIVQVLAPGTQGPLDPRAASLAEPDPRRLAAAIAGLDAFVSADTGPMHLASAAHVPTVGLFLSTNAVQYAPYGPHDLSLDARNLAASDAAAAVLDRLG